MDAQPGALASTSAARRIVVKRESVRMMAFLSRRSRAALLVGDRIDRLNRDVRGPAPLSDTVPGFDERMVAG
jgi:hypothetical protein